MPTKSKTALTFRDPLTARISSAAFSECVLTVATAPCLRANSSFASLMSAATRRAAQGAGIIIAGKGFTDFTRQGTLGAIGNKFDRVDEVLLLGFELGEAFGFG